MKINNKTILIILVIIVFAMLIFIMFWAIEGQNCTMNPLVYGAQKIYNQNGDLEISCSCFILDPKYNNFYFNKDKMWTEETQEQMNFSEILTNQKN